MLLQSSVPKITEGHGKLLFSSAFFIKVKKYFKYLYLFKIVDIWV